MDNKKVSATIDAMLASAKVAIVTVGDGRGFLVETQRLDHHVSSVLVITAAHCLPHLPPPHPASYTEERTYTQILGPLGGEPTVWAECLFVDPIADLAVLGEPDSQTFFDESDAYGEFVYGRPTLRIGTVRQPCPAWLLTRDGDRWEPVDLYHDPDGPWLQIVGAKEEAIAPGTSGSPIVTEDGCAVGIISVGEEMNPALANDLPVRMLAGLLREKGGA